ncbi:DUF5675 family protein [bacterium]|nr:DUF5675 family protein [bacterium]
MKLLIDRYSKEDKQTIGGFYLLNNNNGILFDCHSLELPWKDNKNDISCIPTGEYIVRKRYSKKYKNHLHVTDVEGRTWILIHHGNYHTDILGCIILGSDLSDINKDGHIDVTDSKKTLKKLMKLITFDQYGTISLTIK